ncbi:MAG TPA: hypothetical protein VMT10_02320 [Solirubrobacteraceae bacterium]|nr:hypothetical protein [Solirubrobacteraceae bacterium]
MPVIRDRDARPRRRPSPALILALAALVLSLAGPALAHDATGFAARVISGRTIKRHSISGIRLKNNTLTGLQIDEAKLGPVPLASQAVSAQNATSALNAVNAATAGSAGRAASADELAGHARFLVRAPATSGASLTAALADAPEIPLTTLGPLTLYGRCARDTSGAPVVSAFAYVRTTAAGGLLDAPDSTLQGSSGADDTLGPATAEDRRRIRSLATTGPDSARFSGGAAGAFSIVAGDGSGYAGTVALGAQEGAPPAAPTALGTGSGCLFSGMLERTGG